MPPPVPQTRRRDKTVLSCSFCRGRKLRCDRQSPCGACARRGKPEECIYSSPEQERKNAIDYRPHTRNQRVRQRIARLETLVAEMKDLAQSPHQLPENNMASSHETPRESIPPAIPLEDHATDNMSKLSLTDDEAVYIGSSHWITIMEDIRLLKDELSEDYSESAQTRESTPFDAGLMHGPPQARISLLASAACPPREEILAMIPPRKVVDRLVSHFFNSFDFAPAILNRSKFFGEYANFWTNPSAVPIMWVGLLFSVMTISTLLQQQDAGAGLSTSESRSTMETYRTLTIHCLITGDYLRPTRYTIETLILHFAVDQNAYVDTNVGNWILIGVVIRIALRMGLHRDPSHWPNIQLAQAELRRTIWMVLYQMDFFTSTEVGLPRIIKDSQCDTHPPILPGDNDGGIGTLQPDPTPLIHIIYRHKIIKVAAEIYDATEAAKPLSDIITALAAKLETVVGEIPEWLRYKSLEASITDNPVIILHRIVLDVLIHKAIYLLYRRSFINESAGEESTRSNELCIESALAILDHHRRMGEETEPGGLMFSIRWKVAAISHEFLQATMMLCFALSRLNERGIKKEHPGSLHRRDDIVTALTNARNVWNRSADHSIEAQRAAGAITAVLEQYSDAARTPHLTASDGNFSQLPGLASLGTFDFGQNMALDLSMFAVDDDMIAFGSMLDDFVADPDLNS